MALSPEFQTTMINHEGAKRYAYTDSRGFITVAIGRCMDARVPGTGFDLDEMLVLLNNDIEKARTDLLNNDYCGFYKDADQVRQDVMAEMVFNMGMPNFLKFKDMIQALIGKNYTLAVINACESKWSTEISKERLDNMMHRLEYGEYPK